MSQIPAFVALTDAVKTSIQTCQANGDVRTRVIGHLTEKELQRRTELVVKGMEARKAQEKEIAKIKPDAVFYDGDGKKSIEQFSKQAADNLKKANEKLAKIDRALARALDEANYDDLANVTSSGGGKPEEAPAAAAAE